MHWEKLKNKRTRIQIRKAQNRGCCGNPAAGSQTGAKPLRGGGCGCQAQLPPASKAAGHLPAQMQSTWTQKRGKGQERPFNSIKWAQPEAPTTSWRDYSSSE